MREKINVLSKINYEKIFKTIIDLLLCTSLIVLSIKKGGFYKNDILPVALSIAFLGAIMIFHKFILHKGNKIKKIDIIDLLLISLPLFYALPIIFKNYTNLSDAIFECIRYSLIIVVYFLVRNSCNNKIYAFSIIGISLLQSIIGIDGMYSRYTTKILSLFNSGFLNKDYSRLSGTIQYANVTAIIIFIGIFFIIDMLETIYYRAYKNKNKKVYTFVFSTFLFIHLVALLLTQSRMAIFLFFIMIVIKLFCDKKKMFSNFICVYNIFIAILFISIIQNFYNIKSYEIFIFLFITAIIEFQIILLIVALYNKYKEKILKVITHNKKKITITCSVIFFMYIIIALSIKTPLKLSYSKTLENVYSVDIYDLEYGKNVVEINTFNLDDETNYDIKVYEFLNDRTSKEIFSINSYSSNTGNYIFEYNLENLNFRNLRFEFSVNSGSFSVNNIKINDKNKAVNYALIPRDIIAKIQDILHGSTTISDRIEYNKDSIKIIKASIKNFFFGVGGEGFRNLYETVQELGYYSTEVHNSYMQIFVESGVFGFLSIILIIVFILKRFKDTNINYYLAFLGLAIHMLFDLDFSYFVILLIFTVLIALIKAEEVFENSDIKKEIYSIILTFIVTINLVILIFANISNMNYKKINSSCSDNIEQNVIDINKLEKIVDLDFSEVSYRKKLNSEYFNYLSNLERKLKTYNIEDEVRTNIELEIFDLIISIKENTDKIYEYDKYNKLTLKYVNNIYCEYFEYFMKAYYNEYYDIGKEEYINFIENNISYVKNNIKLEIKYSDVLEEMIKDKNSLLNRLKVN